VITMAGIRITPSRRAAGRDSIGYVGTVATAAANRGDDQRNIVIAIIARGLESRIPLESPRARTLADDPAQRARW